MEEFQKAIIGVSILCLSAVLQIVCLFIMRVLVKLKQGGHISTLRTWLYLGSGLEQLSFITFHVNYHFFEIDLDESDSCIVIRFLQSFCSTFTAMWLLVISCFYLILTIKPEKCFTFHSRFLSHCVTWTWTCVTCLMYLVLAFFIKERQHFDYLDKCWTNIKDTIHMFNTYGNEIIPLFFTFICIAIARYRISSQRIKLENFIRQSECNVTVLGLQSGMNRYFVLLSYTAVYYIVLLFRFLLVNHGSDLLLMIMQASRGISIGVLTCLLDEDVLKLLRRNKNYIPKTHLNGSFKESSMEMKTFIYKGHKLVT